MDPRMMMSAGAGAVGAGLGSFLGGWQNPAKGGPMRSMDNIPEELRKYLGPYIDAGNKALPGLQDQYGRLITDPGARLNEIGQGYHQSPGFQFALQQALGSAGKAAAAGGMAGSPQHEQQNMSVATGLADQDYNQWLGNALGMYKTGLQGQQGLYDTGAHMGQTMGEDMASYWANRAKMQYEGRNAQNQHDAGVWGSIAGGAASLVPFLF